MSRRHDIRRAKRHRTYTIKEVATTFEVTVTTVSNWVGQGLSPIDTRRPYLFDGETLARFLEAKNKPRQPCAPGEVYCVACKKQVSPKGGIVQLVLRSDTTADLIGICPHCGRRPHMRVRLAELTERAGPLTVRYQDVCVPMVGDSNAPRNRVCREYA